MANWNEVLNLVNTSGSTHDIIRRQSLQQLYSVTGRNVIIYYSGWLQKPIHPGLEINDNDKNGFMNAIHHLDRNLGLDLVLHTPGGDTAATESIVDYLRAMFGTDIRAIVPQLALSGGTMIACACREIIMGKHSSLGPIDPQFQGIPAHGVVEEFQRAYQEIKKDNTKAAVWQPIIAKYPPTFIGECEKAIQWSAEMVREWLITGMLKDEDDPQPIADNIIKELGDHALTKSHARHLSAERCRRAGLKVTPLESDPKLQDAVLSVHFSAINTFSGTGAYKIIENHAGVAFIQIQQQTIAVPI